MKTMTRCLWLLMVLGHGTAYSLDLSKLKQGDDVALVVDASERG